MADRVPEQVKLEKASNQLLLAYANESFTLDAEYLRVYSPSAEVRGHGGEQAVLQVGKKHVRLIDLSVVGNYALKLVFDDGHDSGLYTWNYLHELCLNQAEWWNNYLKRLALAGDRRDPDESVIKLME